jgi:malate dehydrogenase
MYKITIVGIGRVGEATAQLLAQRGLCDELMLISRDDGAAVGTALDIQESAPLLRFDLRVRGGTDPALMAGSHMVIVTAGQPRRPGMSRSDVLETNLPIIDKVVDDMLVYAPDALLMMVTNPVDALTFRAWQRTGWSRRRVIGQAGVLDASRMASFVAQETGFSPQDVTAMVLGGHGDAMLPLTRFTCVQGVPVDRFLDQETIARIVQRTRQAGAEILALRRKSSAFDTPAAAIAAMVDAIRSDRRRLMPTVCVLDGEYGERGLAMGVPTVLSAMGAERIVELELTAEEQALFAASAARVREDLLRLGPVPSERWQRAL